MNKLEYKFYGLILDMLSFLVFEAIKDEKDYEEYKIFIVRKNDLISEASIEKGE